MNFDLTLVGSKEFYPKLNKKIYYILKVDTEIKQNFMCDIFTKFIKKQNDNINEKHYIGIDFEFNKISKLDRDVALMQINLENESQTAYIFILYPPELTKKNNTILLKLLTHPNIYKILHGAESLDIPYLFNQMLVQPVLINNFCSNFYDTRFLCDCNHIYNNITNDKCSIYNLLLEQKVITEKKLKDLEKIEAKMGPIHLIKINIHKLNKNILKYALYDVIYLPALLNKFMQMKSEYFIFIPEVTCLINKAKRNIENNFNNLEKIINEMNLYFIYNNHNKPITLNKLWEKYNIEITNNILNKFQQIPYFKKFIMILMKFIIYQNIFNTTDVYKNKYSTITNINWDNYWSWINKYTNINNMLKKYDKLIKKITIKI
jgi:hypothetical protein